MDLDLLHTFLTVAQSSSFSDAAQKLYLTQPAISKRIHALEQELGTPLFDRVGRKVQLTQGGRSLLPRAERILYEVREARRAMDDLAGEVRGELRLATSHHLGLHRLPPILRQYSRLYPDVDLQIQFLDSEVAHDRVLRGECELAVVTLPTDAVPQLISRVIWQDPLAFVAQAESTLPQVLTLVELSQHPAILPDLNTYTGRLVKSRFDHEKLPLTLNMVTNYLETIRMMVAIGLGWSVLPKTMVDDHLRALEVPGVGLSRQLGMVQHEKRHLSNAASAFLRLLEAPQ